jgi:hypothetical protein
MNPEDVQKVYQVFDPGPLKPEETELYVDLDDVRGSPGIVNNLERRIRLADKPTCQIVAGHRGSGKSTELRRLQKKLEPGPKPLFVVYCEADQDIDRNDVDFPEVLIAIVRQLAAQLRDRAEINLKPGYFKDRFQRLKRLMSSEIEFGEAGIELGMLKLSSAIRGSPDARLELRKHLEPDTSNWIYAANDLIGDAQLELNRKGYGGLVIIVDDLDKMVLRLHAAAECSTCEYLFIHREAQLTAFRCHMIYTMPIALAYSGAEAILTNLYGSHPSVVPMTKVRARPPGKKPCEAGVEKFRQIIAKRLERAGFANRDVFAQDKVCDNIIQLSGGQPRELMILMREAIIGSGLPISPAAVDRAKREGRRAYSRQMRAEHWPIIKAVRKDGRLPRDAKNDSAIRELLDSRAVLQYANAEEWYGANPLLPEGPLASGDHK